MDFRPNQNFSYSFRYPSHFSCGTCPFLPLDVLMLPVRRKLQWAEEGLVLVSQSPVTQCQSNSDKYPDWDNQNPSRDLVVGLLINFNDNWISMPITQAASSASRALCTHFQNAASSGSAMFKPEGWSPCGQTAQIGRSYCVLWSHSKSGRACFSELYKCIDLVNVFSPWGIWLWCCLCNICKRLLLGGCWRESWESKAALARCLQSSFVWCQ